MNTATFTPGPWHIDPGSGEVHVLDSFGAPVAVAMSGHSGRQDVQRATAKAIVALPDMVEALRIVANCVPDDQGGVTLGSWEIGKVVAALAKASP